MYVRENIFMSKIVNFGHFMVAVHRHNYIKISWFVMHEYVASRFKVLQ